MKACGTDVHCIPLLSAMVATSSIITLGGLVREHV